jgi:hypothetical protein
MGTHKSIRNQRNRVKAAGGAGINHEADEARARTPPSSSSASPIRITWHALPPHRETESKAGSDIVREDGRERDVETNLDGRRDREEGAAAAAAGAGEETC